MIKPLHQRLKEVKLIEMKETIKNYIGYVLFTTVIY